MRSVDRGLPPQTEDGSPVAFARYQDAAPYLKDRLGRYCSFCERWIAANLAVEHKLPKHQEAHPELEREWTNFLLSCSNCNSAKGTQLVRSHETLWPDLDPTHVAFDYAPSGRVSVSQQLPADVAARAARLLAMVGIDREILSSSADHRWPDRLEVWTLATHSRSQLQKNDTPSLRECILTTAVAKGGFSIWMKVFCDDPTMQRALAACFPGTVLRSWDTPPSDD